MGWYEPYVDLMQLPQIEANRRLISLMQRLRTVNANREFEKADSEYWATRADDEFSRDDHKDRGLFSVFLFNLVHLRPGQGIYLPAGEPHSYLEGTGVEIMANSNNVLRGGSNLDLKRGQSFLIPYGIPYMMSARETATAFLGSVPS